MVAPREAWSTSLVVLGAAVALATSVASAGCEGSNADAREAQIVSVMAAADEPFIRTRPALSAGKYVRMASSVFDFFRGTVPVFRSDLRSGTTAFAVSSFDLDLPLVPSLGDPHPENFGVLRAADGSIALEPNDFDAADHAPYLWDVRRLAAGMALAAAYSNADDEAARAAAIEARARIVGDAVTSYRDAIARAAAGLSLGRVTESKSAIVVDVFRRSQRDGEERSELEGLTVLDGTARRLKRGVIDPEDPQNVYDDLPAVALRALPQTIERWRRTLVAPPPSEHFVVLDAVREFGSGVASWPRVRAIILVRGPSDDPSDDLVLELKELTDSGIGGLYPPGVFHDSVGQRVVRSARAAWARPDAEPYWGFSDWLGFPCQIRLESEGQKNVRIARMGEDEGTVDAIALLGADLGAIVARVHASGDDGVERARAIWKRIAVSPEAFVAEQVKVGIAYAELVVADHRRFTRSLHRRDGLRLGIPFDSVDAPSPDLGAVFGAPPLPPALPESP